VFAALRNFFLRLKKAQLKRALQSYRAHSGPYETIHLSKVLMRFGRGQDALTLISKATRRVPGDPSIRRTYDIIRAKQASVLLRQARAALKQDRSSQNFIRVADLLRARRKFSKSLACIAEARELFPENWGIELCMGKTHFYRANATGTASDFEQSIRHFRAALKLNPENYNTSVFLAIALTRVGACREALQIIERILDVLPGDPKATELKLHLDRLLAATPPEKAKATQEPSRYAPAGTVVSELQKDLPSAVGLFLFSKDGTLEEASVRPTELFDLSDCTEVLRTMIVGCSSDCERIGMGVLSSCHVSGGTWQLLIRSAEDADFVGFFDQSQPVEILERRITELMSGRASRLATQTTH
jgi:tetratricopeptide (TPR) repeat protein